MISLSAWKNWSRPKPDDLIMVKWARSDQEFLPSALAILETPPSPVRIALIWAICAMMSFAILWGYFSHIDILAIAQGKIQPTGKVKTIQPLETGRVLSIDVQNGQHVSAGDVLLKLDPAEATADEQASESVFAAYRAERLRRAAALAAVEGGLDAPMPPIRWPKEIPASIREREERVLKADLGHLKIILQSHDAQIAQKRDEERRLEETIASEQSLIETLKQRVNMRKALFDRNSAPRAALIDAMETLQLQQTALATQKGQLLEARSAQEVLAKDRRKAIDSFVAENSQKLSEVERQADELEQKAAKARVKTDHMTLRSPINGTVLGLSVTTKNQVVTTSEELMRIVPDGEPLEIEAYLENKDIGFVKEGQSAIVKIESFPFTRYGTLDAIVKRVAHDAIPEPDAQIAEGNPGKSKKGAGYFGGGQRVQNLVFPVTLKAKVNAMNIDGVDVPLTPGMSVSVEIKTGKRRILEYLFSPLVETASRALKER